MQQAIYHNTTTIDTTHVHNTTSVKTAKPDVDLVRWIARKWDMIGVLALIVVSAAYEVFALAHTGL